METISALLALCEGNPLVTDGFPSQRPATRSFDVSFDMRLCNNRDAGDLRCNRAYDDVTLMGYWMKEWFPTQLIIDLPKVMIFVDGDFGILLNIQYLCLLIYQIQRKYDCTYVTNYNVMIYVHDTRSVNKYLYNDSTPWRDYSTCAGCVGSEPTVWVRIYHDLNFCNWDTDR